MILLISIDIMMGMYNILQQTIVHCLSLLLFGLRNKTFKSTTTSAWCNERYFEGIQLYTFLPRACGRNLTKSPSWMIQFTSYSVYSLCPLVLTRQQLYPRYYYGLIEDCHQKSEPKNLLSHGGRIPVYDTRYTRQ